MATLPRDGKVQAAAAVGQRPGPHHFKLQSSNPRSWGWMSPQAWHSLETERAAGSQVWEGPQRTVV